MGVGWVMFTASRKEYGRGSKQFAGGDNNTAEILALTEVLTAVLPYNMPDVDITVLTDSSIVKDEFDKAAHAVSANVSAPLRESLQSIRKQHPGISIEVIEGHSDIKGNGIAHNLAREAVKGETICMVSRNLKKRQEQQRILQGTKTQSLA